MGNLQVSGAGDSYFLGNVGIGTTGPTAALDLNGGKITRIATPTIASDAATKGYVDATAGGGVGAGASGQTLRHDGTNWVANSVLYNNGTNVGIGVTSPSQKLAVEGNIIFQTEATGGPASVSITLEPGTTTTGSLTIQAGETQANPAGALYLSGGNNGSLFSDNNGGNVYIYGGQKANSGSDGDVILAHTSSVARGNVGIGTTGPTAALDLNGGKITRIATPTIASDAATKGYVDDETGKYLPLTGGTLTGNLQFSTTKTIQVGSNEWAWQWVNDADTGLYFNVTGMVLETYGNGVLLHSIGATTGDTYIKGNLTIGAGKEINSDGGSMDIARNGDDRIRLQSTSTDINAPNASSQLRLEGDVISLTGANVGIGTTVPGAELEVSGDVILSEGAARKIFVGDRTDSGSGYNLSFVSGAANTNGVGGDVYIYGGANAGIVAGEPDIILAHNGSAAWGSVGIGTSEPTVELDVDGLIRTRPRASATCNAASEGAMYYDSDDDHFYGCDGSTWNQLDAGGGMARTNIPASDFAIDSGADISLNTDHLECDTYTVSALCNTNVNAIARNPTTGRVWMRQAGGTPSQVWYIDSGLDSWTAVTLSDGDTSWCSGLAVDDDDNFYKVSHNNHEVKKYNSSGTWQWTSTFAANKGGFFYTGDSHLYFCDWDNNIVREVDKDGAVITATTLTDDHASAIRPSSVYVDSNGIYIIGYYGIIRYNLAWVYQDFVDLTYTTTMPDRWSWYPGGLVKLSNGDYIIMNANHVIYGFTSIIQIGSDGTFKKRLAQYGDTEEKGEWYGSGTFNGGNTMCFGADTDEIFMATHINKKIAVLNLKDASERYAIAQYDSGSASTNFYAIYPYGLLADNRNSTWKQMRFWWQIDSGGYTELDLTSPVIDQTGQVLDVKMGMTTYGFASDDWPEFYGVDVWAQ